MMKRDTSYAGRSTPCAARFDRRATCSRPFAVCCLLLAVSCWLAAAPVVSSVWFAQRTNSNLVDVWYDLSYSGSADVLTVSLAFSTDGGSTFPIVPSTVSGDMGTGQKPGTRKHIVWDAYKDYPALAGDNVFTRVMADDGIAAPPPPQPIADSQQVKSATPPPAPANKPSVTISGQISGRKRVRCGLPRYPDWAIKQGASGTVVVKLFVAPDGSVRENLTIESTSGYPALDELVANALKGWQFGALDANVPQVDEWGRVTVRFVLN